MAHNGETRLHHHHEDYGKQQTGQPEALDVIKQLIRSELKDRQSDKNQNSRRLGACQAEETGI